MSHHSGTPVVLELREVAYRPRGADALLSDLTLHVHDGEILVIAGPNGAGKSTLIRLIAGLSEPTGGEMLLGGRPYSTVPITERARVIAYVGQSEESDDRLTVSQYVSLGQLPHHRTGGRGDSARATDEALSLADLTRFAGRRMSEISGGERQRAKIARAICQRPRILVLDEPTNHLDPLARGELLSLVSGLGITVVAALHDLTLIEAFASHVALIQGGRLVAHGHPVEVLSSERVRAVFSVDMHRMQHPLEARQISVLDIPIEGRFGTGIAGELSGSELSGPERPAPGAPHLRAVATRG